MPSYTERLIAAHQAGMSERQNREQQAQQQEDRKLQQQILKHQIDRLKITDALEARKAAAETAGLLQGTPGQVVPDTSPEGGTQVLPHPPITVPGIPEFNLPDVNIQPQTLQELLQQQKVAQAQALQQKLAGEVHPGSEFGLFTGTGEQIAPAQTKAPPPATGTLRSWLEVGYPALAAKLGRKPTETESAAAFREFTSPQRAPVPGTDVPLSPEVLAQQIAIAGAKAAATEAQKPPSEGERKAQSFFERATGAEKTIGELAPDISKLDLIGQARLKMAPNVLQSQTGQQYLQAAGDFINATLRRESGAAISASEYERFGKLYFPQPGDTPKTLEQKASARSLLINSIKTEAGRAAPKTGTATSPAPTGKKTIKFGDLPK